VSRRGASVTATILHRFYDLHSGGAEVVILNFVRAFSQCRHVLVFDRYTDTWVARELKQLSNVTLLSGEGGQTPRLLRREAPDVVIFHCYPPMSLDDLRAIPASFASRSVVYNHWYTPVPYVDSIRGYCFPSAYSSRTSGAAVPRARKTTIVNPVSDRFFNVERARDGQFRVGRHSRGTPRKFSSDFFALHEAIEVSGLEVAVLGHPPSLAERLTKDAATLRHRYRLLTSNAADVATFLSSLDVYVYKTHASFTETSPMCILEALASGIPIVAEARGGIRDFIVDEVTGFPCRSRRDYGEAVEALSRDGRRRRRMGVRAREWAREHASIARFRREMGAWLNLPV
jgi:glycosyltransferase involved in cell wall biosynthesis